MQRERERENGRRGETIGDGGAARGGRGRMSVAVSASSCVCMRSPAADRRRPLTVRGAPYPAHPHARGRHEQGRVHSTVAHGTQGARRIDRGHQGQPARAGARADQGLDDGRQGAHVLPDHQGRVEAGQAWPPEDHKWRTRFCIGGDAYRIAASGAAGENVLFQTRELARIGLPVQQESALAPWAPSVSIGAKMQTDEFMRVVGQQARRYAHCFKDGIGKSKRLNKALVRMGFELAKQKILVDTAPGGLRHDHDAHPQAQAQGGRQGVQEGGGSSEETADSVRPPPRTTTSPRPTVARKTADRAGGLRRQDGRRALAKCGVCVGWFTPRSQSAPYIGSDVQSTADAALRPTHAARRRTRPLPRPAGPAQAGARGQVPRGGRHPDRRVRPVPRPDLAGGQRYNSRRICKVVSINCPPSSKDGVPRVGLELLDNSQNWEPVRVKETSILRISATDRARPQLVPVCAAELRGGRGHRRVPRVPHQVPAVDGTSAGAGEDAHGSRALVHWRRGRADEDGTRPPRTLAIRRGSRRLTTRPSGSARRSTTTRAKRG